MKIVNRAEFLNLPADTVFAKYAPCYMESLQIKGDTCAGIDYFCQDISDALSAVDTDAFHEACIRAEAGESVPMDFDVQGRDGCFDEDQLFAVFEPQDVRALIERLQRCLPKA